MGSYLQTGQTSDDTSRPTSPTSPCSATLAVERFSTVHLNPILQDTGTKNYNVKCLWEKWIKNIEHICFVLIFPLMRVGYRINELVLEKHEKCWKWFLMTINSIKCLNWLCGRNFLFQVFILQLYFRCNGETKTHVCTDCAKPFATNADLQRHIRSKQKHINVFVTFVECRLRRRRT